MRLFSIALLLVTYFSTFSQTKTFVGMKIGGGASTAYMQHSIFPVVMDIGWRPGMNAGIQITHFPAKYRSKVNAGIQLGVNYVQKGWVQSFKDTSEPQHKTRINYLEIPIEAVGYFGNRNKIYVTAGFFVEYAIGAKVDEEPSIAVDAPSISSNKVKLVGQSHFYRYSLKRDERLSYGPRGSIGIFREMEKGVLRLETYFSFSARGIFNYEPIESGIPDLALNYGAGFSLAYMFSFGKLDLGSQRVQSP